MSKTIVVTGGAGFIGSHLCERLAGEGHRVISLDNYFTGTKENHVPGVEYRQGHTKDIAALVPETPDLVFHLGEYARVDSSFREPERVFDLNKIGTFGVLEFCRAKGVKLIYAGSSTKFGDGGLGRDQSPYAWTKASNTELVQNYGAWYGLEYAIAYFYNVFGPRERPASEYGTLIETLKRQYLAGEPFTIVAPGTQQRNFTHVADIVDGLVRVGFEGAGDGYGIGNETAYSLLAVAELFDNHSTVMLPQRQGDRASATLDSSKVRALGWEPTHDLASYIADIVRAKPTLAPAHGHA